MTWVVALLGIAVAAIGLLGVVRPGGLIRLVESAWRTRSGFYTAIALRLALGAVLIAAAPECRFPLTIRVIGIVSLAAAVAVAVMGDARLRAFVQWWVERPAGFVRGWAAVAIVFGAFLVYAAV